MAYTNINKSKEYFNTKTYTGTGSSNSQTDIGHQPDLVWVKSRSAGWDHEWYDAVRGVGKSLSSVTTSAESNSPQGVTAFDSDGFTVGTRSGVNENNSTYASWNWKANGAGSANTDGSINSTVSANTTSGFSIVSYTGTGANATVGHGLGVTPKMIIVKNLIDAEPWIVYHAGIDATAPQDYHVRLNTTDARVDEAAIWNDTAPTSSIFSLGSSGAPNGSGDNHIAYCFAEKTGYSKFGSYVGNGNADGTFVYTGFKPAFVMTKEWEGASDWYINDTKRDFNGNDASLLANTSGAEFTSSSLNVDMLSNGFKLRSANPSTNEVAGYIYMAFAEAPLVGTNNVPATAR
jgi:hypothetical protein